MVLVDERTTQCIKITFASTSKWNKWLRELLDNASVVFSQQKAIKEAKKIEEEHRKEVDNLNRIIGKTTVERDYLRQCYEKVSKW